MKPIDHRIYLASKSPRRRELLRQIGVEFDVISLSDVPSHDMEVSEVVLPNEAAADYVARVTREKAACAQQIVVGRKLPNRLILAADTTVVLDTRILGKPVDMAEATAMLTALAGRTHRVLTSVAVCHGDDVRQITQSSTVTFCAMTADAIQRYCMTSEPYDKAGGYGIQGRAACFIQEITGSYSGIMGLPLFETVQLLQQAGLPIL